MASGWNLWVWLECIGVVSGCCFKEVYRYPHNNCFSLLHCLVLALFWQQYAYFFVHFRSCLCFFVCNIANIAQRTFEIVQKSKSREQGDIINRERSELSN